MLTYVPDINICTKKKSARSLILENLTSATVRFKQSQHTTLSTVSVNKHQYSADTGNEFIVNSTKKKKGILPTNRLITTHGWRPRSMSKKW